MSNTWFRLRRGFFLSFFPSDTPHYENVPFELPNSWVWCRLEDIAYVASGSTPDKTCFVENGVPYIKMYNLRNQKIDFAYHPQYITEEVHNGKLQRSRTEVGDLIMNIVGPPLGKLAIIPTTLPQANFNQAAVLIRPYKFKEVLVSYLKVYLEEMSEINSIATRGSAGQVNISLTQSQNMRIPIPPLNEVRRIIEEVSKYDILIDSLKQNITDIQNLIAYTKSKILDLAIRGQLVPQDPDDEPASVLLERIRAEKEELIKQGKIKRDKKESVIFRGEDNSYYEKIGDKVENISDEIPFELPDGWMWCRGRSCFLGMESTKPQGEFFDYIDIDAIDNRLHRIKTAKHLPVPEAPSRASRAVKTGSVLFSLVRPYLENIALVEEVHSHCIASTGFYVCSSNGILLPQFMFFLMISSYVVSGLNQYMKGDNSPSISKDNIESWLYPVPPMAEQKAICTKLKKVFNLIEKVEKSLS